MRAQEPVVAVFRSRLLAGSETFVRNQAAALTRWRPAFLGTAREPSCLAEATDVIAFPDSAAGRLEFLRLRVTGRSPRLRAHLAALRPAVVHAHFGGDGWLISRAAVELRIPLVITVHGQDVTRQPNAPGPRGLRYRRNLRTAFRRASLVIAVSGHLRQQAIALGADPAKVKVHHIGVPAPRVAPAPARIWDVLFVGRFVAKKGIDDLIEALGLLTGVRPRALFVGAGPLHDAMRARAAGLGLDATFLGAQDPAAVARIMATSKIFVSPSKTAPDGDAEGLPTTILEAARVGLPTVSTRHSGIPEAVIDGRTGLLGTEGDRTALARNIERLLADEPLRERLGRQARRHAEAYFDLGTQTRLLEELYDSVALRVRG
ncbi:glycosyltransferase [Actinoplanes sp. NPDC026623]|uniref:glycosyltransferase n=1 Tax=Actinoplanes sp. NPDC026623 TaxID=3155610 RepID=UPI0033D0CBFF